jgi:HPt (histidine-containing phosphotransfer) domain-containing protein
MLKKLTSYLVLPGEISSFERAYLGRMNRIVLFFFYFHLPAFMTIAAACNTNVLLAAGLTALTLVGPTLAYYFFENPRAVSVTFGFTAMAMGGLLVHFGQGPMQIEMHFYFFVLLALLSIFGNPLVIVLAAVTVAAHHALLYFLLPRSVFNYDASLWAVVVHAAFVVLESIAACFMARSFFDNVIGLERIVGERTHELDAVNRDMRLVLDNVGQGFFTVDRQGIMSQERSAVVATWLGRAEGKTKFSDYVGRIDSDFGAWFNLAFDEVLGDTLSLEMSVDQLPKRLTIGERVFELGYRPILQGEAFERLLVVMSDITAELERERFEREQREMVHMLERVSKDRVGFIEYCDEGNEIVERIVNDETMSIGTMKRLIHTLKGNSAIFGVDNIASLCHELEDSMADREAGLTAAERAKLHDTWQKYHGKLAMFGGERSAAKIEIEISEYEACLSALLRGSPRQDVARMVNDWRLEPMSRRLERVAEQARAIAKRIGKGPIDIDIVHNNQKLLPKPWAPFWAAFVHVLRNAIDHGIEATIERGAAGKSPAGRIELKTFTADQSFCVEIRDDGRGVDWAAVRARAKLAGVPADTEEQLTEALFRDGITTRTDVNEFSGRGVGMGAVRAACRELGGEMTLSSAAGKGTTLTFVVPVEATGREIRVTSATSTKLRVATQA